MDEVTQVAPAHLTHPPTLPPGRLSMLALMGAFTGAIPLPFVPSRMLTSVRGAIVHDLVARHGLSLTPDARDILSQADAGDPRRARLVSFAGFLTTRLLSRFGPIRLLTPALSALEAFTLGHLLDRYLAQVRAAPTVRIQAPEARVIRGLIDRALVRCLAVDLKVMPEPSVEGCPDDMRDDITRIVDGIVLGAAAAPAYFVRRLQASFDELVQQTAEAGRP